MSASERPSPEVRLLVASWPDDAPRGSVGLFCREHSVSTSWFYKVRKSALAGGVVAALEPTSTRPKASPNRTSDEVVVLVVKIRAQLVAEGLDHGPLSVLARLRRMGFTNPPSRATLSRIFTQVGVVVAEPKKKPRSAFRRFVYPAPNCLWQIDATEWSLSTGVTCVIFQLIDDHSRLALASLVAAAETSEAAVRVVRIAVGRHGAPQKFLSDNGVAFNPTRRGYTSKLVDYLHSLGVETITGKPYKPTTQGKNERFHRTLHRYLNARPPADSMDELQTLVDAFDLIYNTEREHQSLTGNSTPFEAWTRTPAIESPTPLPTAIEVLAAENTARRTPPGEQAMTVSASGRIYLLGFQFRIGAGHIGQEIHALWDHATIDFYDLNGTQILSHPMPKPGQRSIGNGKPRGFMATQSTKS